MKLKYISLLLAVAVPFLALSCDKAEEDLPKPEPTPEDTTPAVVEGEITLSEELSTQGLVFASDASELSLGFTASKTWSASAGEVSWISLDPAAGEAGTVTVKVKVKANEDYDQRTASITLVCDKASKKVPVTQVQKDALVLAPETIQVPAEGKELEIRLQTNVEVTARPDVDWIAATGTKALAEKTFSFVVAPNEADQAREGHIVFSSTAGSQTITVAQAAAESPVAPDPGILTKWDFSDADWQEIFASLGDPKTELDEVNLEHNGLTISAAAKCKYGDNYFQMPGAGSIEKNYFKFNVGAEGVVTVTQSHTGSTAPDPARYVKVFNNGSEATVVGSSSSTTLKDCQFAVSAGDVYVTQTGGMRIYIIEFTVGGSVEPGDDPGEDPGEDPDPAQPSGDNDELECPNPPTVGAVDMTALSGYAASVTGGEAPGAKVLHFDNGKALQTWLLARAKSEKAGDHTPVTLWLSGTFQPGDGRDFNPQKPIFDVKRVSNLTLVGTDGFVMDRIGFMCVEASNIIIRNINFQQPKADDGADAVSLQKCDGVWIDHCTFTSLNQTKDYEDGSTDITHGSKNVTVSWNHYIKTQKSALVGHSNNETGDSQITATFHHNWFEGSSSRHPRVRFGTVHVYNNLFDGNTTYGVGSAYGAKVLVEYNCFDAVQLPTDICTYPAKESGESNLQGSVAGYLYATQDLFLNKPAKARSPYPLTNVKYEKYGAAAGTELSYADFKPSYTYTVTAVEEVASVVKEGAGYGKLGYTTAPVAVDNGGITDFNGSDPDDPGSDPGDDPGSDPDQPSTGGAHTHVLYYDSSSALQNLTDGVAGSYFTATAKADLKSDYSQNFNPWTIGEYSSTKGVKLNSSGKVEFTTSASVASTVRFYFIRRKQDADTAKIQIVASDGEAQVFDTPYDTLGDSGELPLEKGTKYVIQQKNSEQALLLVIVKESE